MDRIVELAREMGKAIQADTRYIRLIAAQQANDDDTQLQEMIGTFNVKRTELNQEIAKTEKDEAVLTALNNEVRALYQQIMNKECMAEFNAAKQDIDQVMNFVNQILTASISGEDPDSIEEQSSCGGSCSSCSGCH